MKRVIFWIEATSPLSGILIGAGWHKLNLLGECHGKFLFQCES